METHRALPSSLSTRRRPCEGQPPQATSGNTQDPCGPPERPSPRGDGVLRRCAQDRAWPNRQLDRDRPRCRCIGGHLGGDSPPQPPLPPPARPGPCPGTTHALVTPPRLVPLSQSDR